ncbi:MAG TPA: SIMPL domain-containing protein [Planctomycetaceae bacterium]|nr:SIMPL domain-containing protein [Planctomycetaceae bacterium]
MHCLRSWSVSVAQPGVPRWVRMTAVVLGLCGLATTSCWAQFQPQSAEPGITVEGSGEQRATPDLIELNMRIMGRAELTDDAVVKHRDARKRTLESFKALKLDNLKIDERELSLRPGNAQEMWQAAMNGMMQSASKRTQIEISSTLRARLVDVGKIPEEELMSTIGKLLDTAQDSGAGIGPSEADISMAWRYGYRTNQGAIVKFIISDISQIREKAYEAAVQDARQRAQRLARLNGVKLGPVIAVEERSGSGGGRMYYYPWGGGDDEGEHSENEVVADTFSGASIKVKLQVRFAIRPDQDAASN